MLQRKLNLKIVSSHPLQISVTDYIMFTVYDKIKLYFKTSVHVRPFLIILPK
jgi:hypothetical protein